MTFVKGQSGNPGGRPAKEMDYGLALRRAVSHADIGRVGKVVYDKALAGDMQAARLLADYLIAKPTQAIDLTHHRGQLEWDDNDTDAALALGTEQSPTLAGPVQRPGERETMGEIEAGRSVDGEGGA